MQHRLVTAAPAWLRPAPALYLSAAAWAVLVAVTLAGAGAVIRHDRLLQGGPPFWLATLMFASGWTVMVAAMMIPASSHAFARLNELPALARFGAEYLAVWGAFGLAIFGADAGVHQLVNHWLWLATRPWLIAGTTLVLCGAYQLTGIKARALEACRTCPSGRGALHGLQCLGSSGGLMLLAFAFGGASLGMMATLTVYMLAEVSWIGRDLVRPLGFGLIGLGLVVLYGPIRL